MTTTLTTPKTDTVLNKMMHSIIGSIIYYVILRIIYPDLDIRTHHLWIKSPTKHTIKSLPFYQALRTVRKHNWQLVETQPIQQPLTSWQAFKYSVNINPLVSSIMGKAYKIMRRK